MGNDPIEDFLAWFSDLIKPFRQHIDILISNNPQEYVNFVEWFFDFLKSSIEFYKPIAVQNARNYAMSLRDQYKIYNNNMNFFNPLVPSSFINPYWINIMTSKT
ncbi:MAG: hypothetical protein ACTHKK_12440 [Candidatus Nitrosocosmicus sp.]